MIHNHDPSTGKTIYRYPLIQFKVIENMPVIIAITDDAVRIFSEIIRKMDRIIIQDTVIPVYEKNIQVEDVSFGYTSQENLYVFVSPWVGLNQKNYSAYMRSDHPKKRIDLLTRIIIGNMLSMSKYLNYHLEKDQRIHAKIDFQETTVTLKGKKMIGFNGVFKTNFLIPDYLGLGKSVSRGFGCVGRLT